MDKDNDPFLGQYRLADGQKGSGSGGHTVSVGGAQAGSYQAMRSDLSRRVAEAMLDVVFGASPAGSGSGPVKNEPKQGEEPLDKLGYLALEQAILRAEDAERRLAAMTAKCDRLQKRVEELEVFDPPLVDWMATAEERQVQITELRYQLEQCKKQLESAKADAEARAAAEEKLAETSAQLAAKVEEIHRVSDELTKAWAKIDQLQDALKSGAPGVVEISETLAKNVLNRFMSLEQSKMNAHRATGKVVKAAEKEANAIASMLAALRGVF